MTSRGMRTTALVALLAVALAWWFVGRAADPPWDEPQKADQTTPARDRPATTKAYASRELLGEVGVATFNIRRPAPPAKQRRDVLRLLGRDDVDVVLWNEVDGDEFERLIPRLARRGWETAWFDTDMGSQELAISWRSQRFTMVGRDQVHLHDGVGADRSPRPFPTKWATIVRLKPAFAPGEVLTLVNSHPPSHIEHGHAWNDNVNVGIAQQIFRDLAGLYETLDGTWVVGGGDYNLDFHDDTTYDFPRGITETLVESGAASSSFHELGVRGVPPTWRTRRWIDYVFIAGHNLRAREAQFATHRSLGGYASDHRPVLARIRLYAKPKPSYAFPISDCPVSYSADHHNYPATDVFAAEGCAFVAPVAGVVDEVGRTDRWTRTDNRGADRGGLFVSIVGVDGVRYYGSHLVSVAPGIRPGADVRTGARLGAIGETGSAAGTGAHLHFGISWPSDPDMWWLRRGIVSPATYLDAWRDGGQTSPVRAVAEARASLEEQMQKCRHYC